MLVYPLSLTPGCQLENRYDKRFCAARLARPDASNSEGEPVTAKMSEN